MTELTAYNHAHKLFKSIWPDMDFSADEHLVATPVRFVKMLRELTTPEEFEFTTFKATSDQMIVCSPIDFHSLCAHHVVPYIGRAHVAYIPTDKIVGLSKIPRLVKYYSAGLTVQEELTQVIANELSHRLSPVGVAVVMDAKHLCASIRGAECPEMNTITSCMLGAFADHERLARQEFLQFIRNH